jgi:hypothetical protein
MLGCAGQTNGADSVATRVGAYVILQMPFHAVQEMMSNGNVLRPLEGVFFEASTARLKSNQRAEYASFLVRYLQAVGSSNTLYQYHLSNLRADGGIVTNLGPNNFLDVQSLKKHNERGTAVITLSRNDTTAECEVGSYKELADQLNVVSGFRRQTCWEVIVAIGQLNPGALMSIEVIPFMGSDLRPTNRIVVPAARIFKSDDDALETSKEDLILEALQYLFQ